MGDSTQTPSTIKDNEPYLPQLRDLFNEYIAKMGQLPQVKLNDLKELSLKGINDKDNETRFMSGLIFMSVLNNLMIMDIIKKREADKNVKTPSD